MTGGETPVALTIAGSDPSGGAGIEADLKTFHQHAIYGTAAITLIAVQNTTRVHRVVCLEPELVGQQIDAVLEDIPPQAIKTGALGSAGIIEAIAARKFPGPLVVDPVMISSRGVPLLDSAGQAALVAQLLPLAALVTPNLPEAAALAGIDVENLVGMQEAARRIAQLGAAAVLVKGGHLASGEAIDLLWHEGRFTTFSGARVATRHTHGTGCTYSAAITANLARGLPLVDAIGLAKRYLQAAIETAPGLGAGNGPLNHWAETI